MQPPSLEFASVPPDQVQLVWPTLGPIIERTFVRAEGDAGAAREMLQKILAGEWKLWAIVRDGETQAGLVFSVQQAGLDRKVWVHMLAGVNMHEWAAELQQLLLDFRVLVGASSIKASCRPGLARFLKSLGWKRKAILMELDNGR
jgi:hypothetical protein